MTNQERRDMYRPNLPGGRSAGRPQRPPGRTIPPLNVPPCRQKVSHFRRDPQHNIKQHSPCLLPGSALPGYTHTHDHHVFVQHKLGKMHIRATMQCCSCLQGCIVYGDAITDMYPIPLLVLRQGFIRKSDSLRLAWNDSLASAC
jgi:hypothetical protein